MRGTHGSAVEYGNKRLALIHAPAIGAGRLQQLPHAISLRHTCRAGPTAALVNMAAPFPLTMGSPTVGPAAGAKPPSSGVADTRRRHKHVTSFERAILAGSTRYSKECPPLSVRRGPGRLSQLCSVASPSDTARLLDCLFERALARFSAPLAV